MQAYQRTGYGGTEVLQIAKLSQPIAQADEVLIKILSSSINPADWRLMRGEPWLLRMSTGLFKPQQAFLGADAVGIIESVGSEVTQWQKGQRIVTDLTETKWGAFAEYALVPEKHLVALPDHLSNQQAAGLPLAGITALQALRDWGHIQTEDRVLINGASGGVGTYAIQIAKIYGAHVTAVCSSQNINLVQSLGADETVDYQEQDISHQDNRYDLICDLVGNIPIKQNLQLMTPGARALLIGFTSLSFMLRWMMQGTWAKLKTGQSFISKAAQMNTEDLATLVQWSSEGKLQTIIDRQLSFEELPLGIQYSETGRAKGKIILDTSR